MKKALLGAVIAVVVIFGGKYLMDKKDSGSGDSKRMATYSPKEVVDMYIKATLGTTPGAVIDPTLAKTLLGGDMKANFNEYEFIPMSYGIQQGPDEVEYVEEKIVGDTAFVRIWGYWGEDIGRDWTFTLEHEAGEWLITNLEAVEPTDRQ